MTKEEIVKAATLAIGGTGETDGRAEDAPILEIPGDVIDDVLQALGAVVVANVDVALYKQCNEAFGRLQDAFQDAVATEE